MPSTITDRLQGLTTSVAVKAPVLVASTAALTLSSTQVIDGIAVSTGDRVLVKDQAGSTANGIYVVDSAAWSRAKDFDGTRDVVRGTAVYVSTGTANGDEWWQVTSTGINIPGSSAITFSQASHIGQAITVSTFAETLLDDAAASDMRTTLGLVIGTDVQAEDPQLADLAGITPSTGGVLYFAAGSTLLVLAKGSSGTFLQMGTSEPVWASVGSTGVAATQAQMETGSDTTDFVTPGRQHFHNSAAKMWSIAGINSTIHASYNVSSVTDLGTGHARFNLTTPISSSDWVPVASCFSATNAGFIAQVVVRLSTMVEVTCYGDGGAIVDPIGYLIAGFGDL